MQTTYSPLLNYYIAWLFQWQNTPCLKKAVHNCFCHKFVKCPPNLIIFGTQIAHRIGLR